MQLDVVVLTEIGAALATAMFVVRALLIRRAQVWWVLPWMLLFGVFSLMWTYGCIVLFYLIGAMAPKALLFYLMGLPLLLWFVGLWAVQRRLLRPRS